MSTKGPPGPVGSVILALLVGVLIFCGVDAILSDSVTTPAKFGGDHRVYGTDTVFVGVGWILMGLSLTAKLILSRRNTHAGTVVAVTLAAIGGLLWLVAV